MLTLPKGFSMTSYQIRKVLNEAKDAKESERTEDIQARGATKRAQISNK
jgi:hypothetical protein